MCMNVVAPKSLHTKVIYKAISFHYFYLSGNLLVWNFSGNKTQCNAKPITLQIAQINLIKDSFKRANFNFRVPILTSLLSNQLFSICPLNSSSLRCDTSFVLVTCYINLLGCFSDSFGYVVNSMHRLYIFLVNND